jgi:hypothetical protein
MILSAQENSLKTFWAKVSIAILTSSDCDIDKNIMLMFRNRKFRLRRRTILSICITWWHGLGASRWCLLAETVHILIAIRNRLVTEYVGVYCTAVSNVYICRWSWTDGVCPDNVVVWLCQPPTTDRTWLPPCSCPLIALALAFLFITLW